MRILVLNCMSRNALAVAKSLSGEHELYGATQRVRAPEWLFRLLATKRFRDIGFHDDPYEDMNAFVQSVIGLIRQHKIEGVIGTGTATTDALVDQQRQVTEPTGARILAGDAKISLELTDKWSITLIATRAGVAMPRTCLVTDLGSLAATVRAAGMGLPFIIKPRRRSSSVGVRIFRDWDTVSAFEKHAATSHQVGQNDGYVAQALMDGDLHDGNCVAKNGRIVALMSQARVVTAWDFGGGGIINKTHREPQIFDAVRRIVETTGYTGIAQFEFIRTAAGTFLLIECNPKIFGTTFLSTAAGINLVKHAVDALLLDKDVAPQEQYEEGLLYRWLFPDCFAYWVTSPLTLPRIAARIRKTFSGYGARRSLTNLTVEDIVHQTGNVIGALLANKKLNRN